MFQFVSGLISATPRKRASPHGKVALSPLTIAWRSRVRNPQKPPCHHDFDFSGLRQPTPAFAKRPGGAGGPPPGPPPSDDGSSDSSSTDPTSSNSTDGSTAKILEQVLQALQQSQSFALVLRRQWQRDGLVEQFGFFGAADRRQELTCATPVGAFLAANMLHPRAHDRRRGTVVPTFLSRNFLRAAPPRACNGWGNEIAAREELGVAVAVLSAQVFC
ncbi:hypothetical protein ACVWZ4_004137 [Bradyrhizobium sp. USDA 4472]